MADAITILRSGIDANTAVSDVIARNIAGANQAGYTQKEQVVVSNVLGGTMAGVLANQKDVKRHVVDTLVTEIRNQQTKVCYLKTLSDMSTRIQQIHGNKGTQNSTPHDIQNCLTSIQQLSVARTDPNATQVAHQFDVLAQNLVKADQGLQSLIYEANSTLISDVKDANSLIADITQTARNIVALSNTGNSVVDLEDKLDQDLHNLANYLNINVSYSKDIPPRLSVITQNGLSLINNSTFYNTLEYPASTNIPAGTDLPDISINGTIITDQITSGTIAANRYLVNTTLNQLRDSFSELTRQVRDQVNAIHNLGMGRTPPDTLRGTIGTPGSGGALTSSTPLSGTGTVRIGTLDSSRNLASYVDIDLSTISDMTALEAAINVTASGVSASISADGRLVLTTNTSGNGVAIGSVGAAQATMTDTTNSTTYGFSHYFGLNNVFVTEGALPGEKIAGMAGIIQIRSDLVNNGKAIAYGRLDSSATPSGEAILLGDTSILQNFKDVLSIDTLTVPAAGDIPITYCTLIDYARRIVDNTTTLYKDSSRELEREKDIYMELSIVGNEVSGVDIRAQLLEMVKNSENQKVAYKALQMCLDMQRSLLDIMR